MPRRRLVKDYDPARGHEDGHYVETKGGGFCCFLSLLYSVVPPVPVGYGWEEEDGEEEEFAEEEAVAAGLDDVLVEEDGEEDEVPGEFEVHGGGWR